MFKKIITWAGVFLVIILIIKLIAGIKVSGVSWSFISDSIGLVTAIVAVIGLVLQIILSRREQDSFRQQLVSVLHHAAGIVDALSSLEKAGDVVGNPLLKCSIESVRKSAGDLQMGLIETKVGGKQLSNDLDQAYKDWAKMELELRLLPMKDFLAAKNRERELANAAVANPSQE